MKEHRGIARNSQSQRSFKNTCSFQGGTRRDSLTKSCFLLVVIDSRCSVDPLYSAPLAFISFSLFTRTSLAINFYF